MKMQTGIKIKREIRPIISEKIIEPLSGSMYKNLFIILLYLVMHFFSIYFPL